jgi:hypothetical protein
MNAPELYIQYSADSANWVNVVLQVLLHPRVRFYLSNANVVPAEVMWRFKNTTYNPSQFLMLLTLMIFAVQTNGVLSEYDFNNDLLNKNITLFDK